MKRCINRIIDWFKTDWEIKISCLIGIISAIAVGVITFICMDIAPATESDYDSMEEQITAIQKEPNSLFEIECDFYSDGKVIKVILENEECKIIVQFDQNFEILSTSREDKCIFWLGALAASLFFGIVGGGAGIFVTAIVIAGIEILAKSMQNENPIDDG